MIRITWIAISTASPIATSARNPSPARKPAIMHRHTSTATRANTAAPISTPNWLLTAMSTRSV